METIGVTVAFLLLGPRLHSVVCVPCAHTCALGRRCFRCRKRTDKCKVSPKQAICIRARFCSGLYVRHDDLGVKHAILLARDAAFASLREGEWLLTLSDTRQERGLREIREVSREGRLCPK